MPVFLHPPWVYQSYLPAPTHRFLATGDPEPFERLGRRFLGPEVGEVAHAERSPGLLSDASHSA